MEILNACQLINQTSGIVEYYTPHEIIEAARVCLGAIDLDPASSDTANLRVCAKKFFSEQDNGLIHPWKGRVWMNHPFGRVENPLWISKLISEFGRNCTAFCAITFAATSEQWFKPLMSFPQCYLSPRTNYYLPDGTKKIGVSKGSVVTSGGIEASRFYDAFSAFGSVMVPYKK